MATVTKKDLNQLEERIDSKIDKAVSDLTQVINDVVNSFGQEVVEIKQDIKDINSKYDHVMTTLDSLAKNLDDFTTEMRARDAEVARLKRWVEQIAEKTGIKLEY